MPQKTGNRVTINFLNEYYLNKSSDQNASDLVNMYLEADSNNGKYQVTAFPTPGLTVFNNGAGSVVRGAVQLQNVAYFVVDNKFNSYSSTGVLTNIGTLQTSTGSIQISTILNQIMIVDGSLGYNYNISTGTFQVVNTANSTLSSTAIGGATTLSITSTAGMSVNDNVAIKLDNGTYFWTYITNLSPFTIHDPLPSQATSGNLIYDSPLPAYPTILGSQDEFFLLSGANSGRVYQSNNGDGLTWGALAYYTKSGEDFVKGIVSNKHYVYIIGEYQSEVLYNAGTNNFSFLPIGPGSYFFLGTNASQSISRTGCTILKARDINSANTFLDYESIVFLGQSPNGGKQVVLLDQYKPIQISNRAIAYQINKLTNTSDAVAYTYDQNGHSFYVLTFPTDGKTFTYDLTTGLWNELQSYVNSTYTRHLSNCYVYCYGKHLVGDYQSGKIYYLDPTVYQDNGVQIKRFMQSPPGYQAGKKVFFDRLQIDFQTNVGSNLPVTLNVSKDSGQTFGTTYTGNIPAAGGRLFWNTLGMTQNAFVFNLTFTGNANFTILGAQADIRVGVN